MEGPQPRKRPMSRARNIIFTVTIVVVAYIAVQTLPSLFINPVLTNTTFESGMGGWDEQIPPHLLYLEGNLTVNSTSRVNGTFGGSTPIIFYAFNQSQFSSYISSGTTSPNLFHSETVLSGTANFTVGPGSVFITFYDPGNTSATIHYYFEANRINSTG